MGKEPHKTYTFTVPKIIVTMIFHTDGVALNVFVKEDNLSTTFYISGLNVRNEF
jgi:hypothetical protein